MKKALLLFTVLLIVGILWHIESTKPHVGTYAAGNAPQAIGIPVVENTSTMTPVIMTHDDPTENDATNTMVSSEALNAIAMADQNAGYKPAIEIVDPTGFVNVSSTFKLSGLIGKKVILLEFWTYSCINCIHTLPYLTSWYSKYKDQGLVVVGIQTPEFAFEKNIANVEAAAVQYGIQYPIVLDNNYATWDAYGNLYWPHQYLIDIAGYIVHDHIGEGDYGTTEGIIQRLLQERALALGDASSTATSTP